MMDSDTGYFVLADIAGFTAYLAEVELDHARSILADLLELVIGQLVPPLSLAEVAGDAVLAYAPTRRLLRGETLLELVEATYAAFRDRLTSIARRTTCTCRACRAVPTLDLKLMVHTGDYLPHATPRLRAVAAGAARDELLGAEVDVLRQRWLKGPVSAATGWRGFALFTAASLARMGVPPEALLAHTGQAGHRQPVGAGPAGPIVTYTLDLQQRYADRLAARQAVVTPGDADLAITQDCPAPPPVVWEWLNDPARRSRWTAGRAWRRGARPGGRTAVGASNHCEHGLGTAVEVVVDWRPFDTFTTEVVPRPGNLTVRQTYRLEPLPSGRGTRVHCLTRFGRPLPRWLARPLGRVAAAPLMRGDLARLARLLTDSV